VTPLHRFEMNGTSTGGFTFGTPFSFNRNEESADKCLKVGTTNGDPLSTDRCSRTDTSQLWVWKSGQVNKTYVLSHKASGRCAKPQSRKVGSKIEMVTQCDNSDKDVLWETLL